MRHRDGHEVALRRPVNKRLGQLHHCFTHHCGHYDKHILGPRPITVPWTRGVETDWTGYPPNTHYR